MRLRQSKLWDELNQLKVVSVCDGVQADRVWSCAETKATRPRRGSKLARESIMNVMVLAIGECVEMSTFASFVVQLRCSLEMFQRKLRYIPRYMHALRIWPLWYCPVVRKEVTSCEYGLGMLKCCINEKDPNSAYSKETV